MFLFALVFDTGWILVGSTLHHRSLDYVGEWPVFVRAYLCGIWENLVASSLIFGAIVIGVWIVRRLETLLPRDLQRWNRTIAILLTLSPLVFYIVYSLSFGGSARRYLAGAGSLAVATTVLLAMLGVAIHVGFRWIPIWAKRLPRGFLVSTFVLALAIMLVDQFVFPQQYALLHGGLVLIAIFGVGVGVVTAERDRSTVVSTPIPRWRRRASSAIVLAFIVAVPIVFPWDTRPLENFYLARFAPITGKSHLLVGKLYVAAQSLNELKPHADPSLAQRSRAPSTSSGSFDEIVRSYSMLPNVIILSVDGLSPWRASIDFEIQVAPRRETTPFLREMTQRGLSFSRYYTTYPGTEAALLSLLSGEFQHEKRKSVRDLESRVLPAFRRRGYLTYCDLPFVERLMNRLGETKRCSMTISLSNAIWSGDGLINFLTEHRSQPTFALVHLLSTHLPYQDLGAVRFGDSKLDRYDTALRGTDDLVRSIYQRLSQLSRPTIVIFTSDHGHAFGWRGIHGHNTTLYEDQIRVPLIIVGDLIQHRREDAPISLLELSAFLSGDASGERIGFSWKGHFSTKKTSAVFERDLFVFHGDQGAMLRGNMKLIIGNSDGVREFYDVVSDPEERRNLINEQPEKASDLYEALRAVQPFTDEYLEPLP